MTAVQPFLIGEGWQEIKDGDVSLMSMFRRHYSYTQPAEGKRKKNLAIGPGFKLVLMTADGGAICSWRKEKHRRDGQEGVNCSIYRREYGGVASSLLKDAMALAWKRWPSERLFTFVDPKEVTPTMMRGRPTWGHCFYEAGWRFEGLTKTGLHILAAYSDGGSKPVRATTPKSGVVHESHGADRQSPKGHPMTSNISDDADFLLSLVPFLDAHHVRTDRIEAIANRLRVMPTEEMIEAGAKAICRIDDCDPDALEPGNTPYGDDQEFIDGTLKGGPAYFLWRNYVAAALEAYTAMQSTLLKEG